MGGSDPLDRAHADRRGDDLRGRHESVLPDGSPRRCGGVHRQVPPRHDTPTGERRKKSPLPILKSGTNRAAPSNRRRGTEDFPVEGVGGLGEEAVGAPAARPASLPGSAREPKRISQFTRRSASPVMTSVLARIFSSRDDASWTPRRTVGRGTSGGVGLSSRLRTNPSISRVAPGCTRLCRETGASGATPLPGPPLREANAASPPGTADRELPSRPVHPAPTDHLSGCRSATSARSSLPAKRQDVARGCRGPQQRCRVVAICAVVYGPGGRRSARSGCRRRPAEARFEGGSWWSIRGDRSPAVDQQQRNPLPCSS